MPVAWEKMRTVQLLDVRLSQLGLRMRGSWVEPHIGTVLAELKSRGLRLKPRFWFSDEWFSPVGVAGVAVPFYLAHPRLIRLERKQMLEAEGGTASECKRLLRHEIGHTIEHAFALHRRPAWRKHFGRSSEPYPDRYAPDPASRAYVHHLDAWYAQSHPCEDFAETFAVWLTPRSNWRHRYRDWPALAKLEYVDELMDKLSTTAPRSSGRTRPGALSGIRHTLRTHYARKRERYLADDATSYDYDLLKIFTRDTAKGVGQSAASFLRSHRRQIRESVAKWTGENLFAVDQILKEIITRCRELELRAVGSSRALRMDVTLALAVHTVHLLHSRRQTWLPL